MEKNIQINILNESGTYDILYPQTTSNQVIGMPTSLPANGGNAATVGGQTPQQIINSALNQGAKVQFGSYTGTGSHGQNNPNILTFAFTPKIIIIREGETQYATIGMIAIYNQSVCYMDKTSDSGSGYNIMHLIWSNNSISWYTTYDIASFQLNASGDTYYYCVIG